MRNRYPILLALAALLWLAWAACVCWTPDCHGDPPAIAAPPHVAVPRLGQPEIVGPEKVDPYKLVRLSINGEADSAVWFVEPAEAADLQLAPGGLSVVFVGPPAKYVVNAVTIKGGALGQARKVVTIGNPQPGPGPQPDPGPNPPNPQSLWLIVIEETSQRTPAQARVMEALRQAAGSKHQYRQLDKDAPGAFAPWASRVASSAGGKLPCLFIADESGKVLSEGALPEKPEDAAALVKKCGG